MKRKIIILLIAAIMLASLSSCTYIPSVDADVITMITIEADAKIELMVSPKNIVVSATPLNDIASIIMVGEDLTDKKPDEAAADFITLAAKAGLVLDCPVKLSVSGDSDYTSVISELISKKIVKALKKEGISSSVEMTEAMTKEELSSLCLEKGYITEKDVEYFSYKRLVYTLANKRVGSLEMPTNELKDFLYISGDISYNIFINDETLADLLTKQDDFPEIYAAYNSATSAYKVAAQEFEEFYLSSYFDADSDYQKALSEMRDAKEALLNRNGSAEALADAEERLKKIDTAIKDEIKSRLASLDQKLSAISEVEKEFDNISELGIHLKQTYGARIQRIKDRMSSFTADFGKKIASEIKFVTDTLQARKDNLTK